jgi:hypothetical protein
MITQIIHINQLENNTGQIRGVNQNPRDLTKEGFALAIKSIQDFPEMLEARELVVVKHNDKYVVIGGNQRLRALKELGYTEATCKVVNWSADKINEFIVKDNLSYGVWDWNLIANEWDEAQLIDWGMDIPVNFNDVEPEAKIIEKTTVFGLTIETESKMNFDVIKRELDRLKIGYSEFEK